jgi:hypothetical protein
MRGMDEARALLRHTVATVAYRGGKALRDAPEHFASYRLSASSRTPAEILAHMGDLFDWALSMANSVPAWTPSQPQAWDRDVARFFEALTAFDARLAQDAALGAPASQLFQGPIADALTHVGQLALLRRTVGSPVRGENYFKADIEVGRTGARQAAPRLEF